MSSLLHNVFKNTSTQLYECLPTYTQAEYTHRNKQNNKKQKTYTTTKSWELGFYQNKDTKDEVLFPLTIDLKLVKLVGSDNRNHIFYTYLRLLMHWLWHDILAHQLSIRSSDDGSICVKWDEIMVSHDSSSYSLFIFEY